jgi:hypothetical protein
VAPYRCSTRAAGRLSAYPSSKVIATALGGSSAAMPQGVTAAGSGSTLYRDVR